MKKILYFIFFLIVILAIINAVLILLANSKILIEKEVIFTLKAGTGHIALGKQLYANKMINQSQHLFWRLLYFKPELSQFKAGTYRFTPKMGIKGMLQMLKNGKEAQFQLRFVEGMRLSDCLKQLRKAAWIKHVLKDDNYTTVAEALQLKHSIHWLEGWFWPDTWIYTACTTDIDILKRAHKKMIAVVDKIWEGRAKGLPYKDKNQFVTMASIIEKETAIADERNMIASVFVNRLHIGMRLQTDPTVIYGIGNRYTGKILRKDIETPTAYNTYIINGLPPGPIAIPNSASLDAAVHPLKTSYLYFVADGKGRHTFNTRLTDHNRSIQDYLSVLKEKNTQ